LGEHYERMPDAAKELLHSRPIYYLAFPGSRMPNCETDCPARAGLRLNMSYVVTHG
jgi:hypothetical protein